MWEGGNSLLLLLLRLNEVFFTTLVNSVRIYSLFYLRPDIAERDTKNGHIKYFGNFYSAEIQK